MTGPGVASRLLRRLRGGGLPWLLDATLDRVAPARPALGPAALAAVENRPGLELGGPSRVFAPRGILPVYARAAKIDNVNFATETAWESGLRDGGPFAFHPDRAPGKQWLREAVALTGLVDDAYDFVLSSHCLEHVANPLRALREWRRVTRPGGHLLLILPNPAKSFDHRRPVTTIAHLREDCTAGTGEEDTTHVAEALALHDLARDAGIGSRAEFETRVRDNARNRCLHHHVFDLALMRAALADTGWHVLATEAARPIHLIALARKAAP